MFLYQDNQNRRATIKGYGSEDTKTFWFGKNLQLHLPTNCLLILQVSRESAVGMQTSQQFCWARSYRLKKRVYTIRQ